ncbi:MAG: helix-hairpin-helix domain-containing protein, partial [Hyphomicrobiaceae bacterium]
MESQVATSLFGLEAELHRLEAMAANATGAEAAAMRNAASLISDAITVLAATKSADAAPSAREPTQPRIADRIVMIAPHDGAETFRTKVKLKAPEPSIVAAPAVTTTVATDDLTRIRGIDAALAGRLAANGVKSFAAIAAWSHLDVRRISDALGLNREISRQNWIEQAALLSGSKALSAQQLVPEPMVVAEPTTPSPPDRLDLIAGIDIGMAETLKAFGITRWAEIAAWRRDDLKRFGAQVVRPAAIMRQGWIEQAALLASGRLSHHAMRVLRGDFA